MLNIKTGSTLPTHSGHDEHQHIVDDKMSLVRFLMLTDELETDATLGIASFRDETYF
jgi:hypothetical protein